MAAKNIDETNISLAALKKSVQQLSGDNNVDLSSSSLESKKMQMRIRMEELEWEQIIGLRAKWAKHFLYLMWGISGFEILLVISVGFGIIKFTDEWFVRLMIIGGFGQLLLMPQLVAKFLFNKDSMQQKI